MKSPVIARKLAALAAVKKAAVTKKAAPTRASAQPRKRQASDSADWDSIIDSAAKIALSYAFANAVDNAVDGADTEEEPILKRAPWGGGDHIEDYSPDAPEAFRKFVESALVSAWGKDAILADCAAFKAEGYGNEDLYGSDLAMQATGSGVTLGDDGFES